MPAYLPTALPITLPGAHAFPSGGRRSGRSRRWDILEGQCNLLPGTGLPPLYILLPPCTLHDFPHQENSLDCPPHMNTHSHRTGFTWPHTWGSPPAGGWSTNRPCDAHTATHTTHATHTCPQGSCTHIFSGTLDGKAAGRPGAGPRQQQQRATFV